MIRLGTKAEPKWLTLAQDVRVRLRPFNAAHEMSANRAGNEVVRKANGGGIDWGEYELALYLSLARERIDAWENVLNKDGTPAQCTPENVEALMCEVEGMAVSFRREYILLQVAVAEEKKDSVLSPNGIGTPERTPAHGTAPPAKTATDSSALTS